VSATDTEGSSTTKHAVPGRGRVRVTRRRFARNGSAPVQPAFLGGPITEGPPRQAVFQRDYLSRRALAAADVVVAVSAILLVLPLTGQMVSALIVLCAAPAMVLLNKVAGLYDRDELVLKKTTLDEAPSLLQVAGLYVLLLWLSLEWLTENGPAASGVLLLWAATCFLLLFARGVARWLARQFAPTERCLVVGDPESLEAVAGKIASSRLKAEVVGSIDIEAHPSSAAELGGLVWAGIQGQDVHRVIVALPAGASADVLDLVRIAKHMGVRVSILPRVFEVVGSAVEFDHLDGITMLGVRRFGMSRSSRRLKRAFDVLGASLGLAAVSPVMLAIALAIRAEGRGPILFRQTRVGKEGERFEMLKFRSMVPGADDQKDALRPFNETEGLFKIADDPRVTRVGRFLRRTSLDELPQLINVWQGQMSLVGPRPLVVDEDSIVRGFDRQRLHLTPGMTGHWQILGSARLPLQEMVGIDYLYVANWSLWTDVKILLRTVPYVLSSRGL
jgi:exopolysaccharide biosynthesis polyprenyl glycosylphosphotransferase